MDLADFRKEYSGRGLARADMLADPFEQFSKWFSQAVEVGFWEPNAMTLATVNADGQPFQRIVLLKQINSAGFVFFSNYMSRKARHLESNPRASLLFPWVSLERQVIVQGVVEKVSREDSQEYFHSRPRESQIGAWVSRQSEVIESRAILKTSLAQLEEMFAGKEVPLPPFWGGYRVIPDCIEFWQGGPARLHDRFLYSLDNNIWDIKRLAP